VRIEGTSVLVTGAGGGIGTAIVTSFAAAGASVILSGRRPGPLETLARDVGGRVVIADLARSDAVDDLAAASGPLDVLIANAALPASGPLLDYDPEQIDRALAVNLRAPIQLTRALLPGMLERGRGHIVLVSSLAGVAASVHASLYNATKFGLRGFALGLRQDLRGTGVGVSVVLPGFIRDAGMFADTGASLPSGVGTRTPAQVADAVLRAVRADRAQVTVAPPGLALGALVGGAAPGMAAWVQRRLGGAALAEQIAAAQRHRR
jgi:short-subunit dehydrogenase